MCDKLLYSGPNPRIDSCIGSILNSIRAQGFHTISSCCGHRKYPMTIVVKNNENGLIFEYFTGIVLRRRKKNRYYKRDEEGYYYIPEIIEEHNGDDEGNEQITTKKN
jgi:hypothetical protein